MSPLSTIKAVSCCWILRLPYFLFSFFLPFVHHYFSYYSHFRFSFRCLTPPPLCTMFSAYLYFAFRVRLTCIILYYSFLTFLPFLCYRSLCNSSSLFVSLLFSVSVQHFRVSQFSFFPFFSFSSLSFVAYPIFLCRVFPLRFLYTSITVSFISYSSFLPFHESWISILCLSFLFYNGVLCSSLFSST